MPSRSFSVSDRDYPFEDHWFSHRGAAMHYVDTGLGTPVVMLHGNPTWSFLYRRVISALDGRCRTIAPDYPGFGFSEHPEGYGYTAAEHADAVLALIDHLDPAPFILVVQDWGGPIGLSVATRRPDKIAGLVVCNTWCWRADQWAMKSFSWLMGSAIGRYLILHRNVFADHFMAGALRATQTPADAVLQAYKAPFATVSSRRGTYVFPRELTAAGDWLDALEGRLGVLRDRPVALVWGMRDPIFSQPRVLARWKRHFPNALVEELPDAGHFLQEDRPDRIAAAVDRFSAGRAKAATRNEAGR